MEARQLLLSWTSALDDTFHTVFYSPSSTLEIVISYVWSPTRCPQWHKACSSDSFVLCSLRRPSFYRRHSLSHIMALVFSRVDSGKYSNITYLVSPISIPQSWHSPFLVPGSSSTQFSFLLFLSNFPNNQTASVSSAPCQPLSSRDNSTLAKAVTQNSVGATNLHTPC